MVTVVRFPGGGPHPGDLICTKGCAVVSINNSDDRNREDPRFDALAEAVNEVFKSVESASAEDEEQQYWAEISHRPPQFGDAATVLEYCLDATNDGFLGLFKRPRLGDGKMMLSLDGGLSYALGASAVAAQYAATENIGAFADFVTKSRQAARVEHFRPRVPYEHPEFGWVYYDGPGSMGTYGFVYAIEQNDPERLTGWGLCVNPFAGRLWEEMGEAQVPLIIELLDGVSGLKIREIDAALRMVSVNVEYTVKACMATSGFYTQVARGSAGSPLGAITSALASVGHEAGTALPVVTAAVSAVISGSRRAITGDEHGVATTRDAAASCSKAEQAFKSAEAIFDAGSGSEDAREREASEAGRRLLRSARRCLATATLHLSDSPARPTDLETSTWLRDCLTV